MSEKFKNKYRSESTRAQWWDYSRNGAYFITINTKNRECFFGEIHNKMMNLSDVGQLADKYWLEIPDHFPGVTLDAHIVMPNHVHGILVIEKMDGGGGGDGGGIVRTPKLGVPTDTDTTDADTTDTNTMIPTNTDITSHRTEMASQKWIPQSLGVIINQYKRKCTIEARKINTGFAWQSLYHDHIIRNEQEFQRIRQYIINNPAKWGQDS